MADINRLMDKDLEEIDVIGGKLQVETKSSDAIFNDIKTNTSAINTLLQNAKDPLNTGIATLDIEHYEIHEGDHFLYSGVVS